MNNPTEVVLNELLNVAKGLPIMNELVDATEFSPFWAEEFRRLNFEYAIAQCRS
jgi:hypothetical protein